MNAPSHTRNRDFRNLYQATPIKGTTEETVTMWERTTRKMVNEGHLAFWKRRGIKPPKVSNKVFGGFDMPSGEEVNHVS